MDESVDLAGIELRRRNVALHVYVAQRLPTLMVDETKLNVATPCALALSGGRSPA